MAATAEAPPRPGGDGMAMPDRIWAIVALSFGTALTVVDGTIPNVGLPAIARELGVGLGTVTGIVTFYQLVLVMGLLPFSSLGERYGLRRIYQSGQIIFGIASLMILLAHSFWVLLLLRGAQALGAAMALSVASALLRQIYPTRHLGSGLGLNSVIVASSNALAPTLGGLIISHFDWRLVFVAAAPLAVVSLLLGRALPDPAPTTRHFDWKSGLWSAAGVLGLIGGVELGVEGHMPLPGMIVCAGGVALITMLVRHEKRRAAPVFPVDLLGHKVILLSTLGAIAGFVASSALVVALPFRFERVMHMSPEAAGLAMTPFPLTMLVIAPLSGWLSDRVSAAWLGMAGMAIAVAGLLLVAFMPADAGHLGVVWRLMTCALGFGLFFSPNARMIIGTSPRARAAAAGGLIATGRLFGQTLGAALVGVLLSFGVGLGPVPLLAGACLAALAGIASGFRGGGVGARGDMVAEQ
ncbi:MAG TPA: MFS transporter [Novosphingobium sp.]|nr:MFS transporter [Novosphingobium sp.]